MKIIKKNNKIYLQKRFEKKLGEMELKHHDIEYLYYTTRELLKRKKPRLL